MSYKLKSAVQWLFSILPGSLKLNRTMQLYVTRSLPVSDAVLDAKRDIAKRHIANFLEVTSKRPHDVLDIGSGADLALPILMAQEGARVTASDVSNLASNSLVGDILNRTNAHSLEELGVDYLVYSPPHLPLPDASFDLITSTSVLEHVPREQISELARENARLIKPGGVVSHYIAHFDHWSGSDSRVHVMNYLRFSDRQWRRYNPPLMYQNRLLHSDYRAIFNEFFDCNVEVQQCDTTPDFISESFKEYSDIDLRTTHTWLIGVRKDEG